MPRPIFYILLVLVALSLIPMGLIYKSMHSRKSGPRIQVVYDMDDDSLDPVVIDALMESEAYASFGPDTLAEARNRGYRLWRGQRSE